jgi:hypothetical protein
LVIGAANIEGGDSRGARESGTSEDAKRHGAGLPVQPRLNDTQK